MSGPLESNKFIREKKRHVRIPFDDDDEGTEKNHTNLKKKTYGTDEIVRSPSRSLVATLMMQVKGRIFKNCTGTSKVPYSALLYSAVNLKPHISIHISSTPYQLSFKTGKATVLKSYDSNFSL